MTTVRYDYICNHKRNDFVMTCNAKANNIYLVLPSVSVGIGGTKESLKDDGNFLVVAIKLISMGTDAISYYHLFTAYALMKAVMFTTSLKET